MSNKAAVYIKKTGDSPVPVTVRISWLPCGTISPLIYWTPDGTCYNIISQTECTPLAFLKDRGEGLRFKVVSIIVETPEPLSELLNTRHETYLYLTGKRFCEKNIIDSRYEHAGKEYVAVTLDVFPDGDYELISFRRGEELYEIEKTIAIEPRGAYNAGGMGLRHSVDIRIASEKDKRHAALYLELNKWFISTASASRA